MPSSTVSPRSAILCAGSDASFLKVSRTPNLSTVKMVFEERTCTRTREQACLALSNTTARRNLLVSSAVSRSSNSALRKPRSIAILYCIVSGAPRRVAPLISIHPPLGRWASAHQQKRQQKRQRMTVVLFVDDIHLPAPRRARGALSVLATTCQPSGILTHDLRCKSARDFWSDWTIFFGRIALRKDLE